MNIKKGFILLSIFTSMLFSVNNTFSGSGGKYFGAAFGGAVLGNMVGSGIANAQADNYYRRENAREDRYRAEKAEQRRRDAVAQRRHEEKMAAIRAQDPRYMQKRPDGYNPYIRDVDYGYNE